MNQDWTIQVRSEVCNATQTPFVAGEAFHTLLFQEPTGLRREDLCESAFKARDPDAPTAFSHWRSKFEPTPAKPQEALGKQTAEQLLRHYMADPDPKLANVRYILAVMLERKRTIKEVETARAEDGTLLRIYQFPKTGEALVIPDPQLRLDQIANIQMEVAELLGAPAAQSVQAESLSPTEPGEPGEPAESTEPTEPTEPTEEEPFPETTLQPKLEEPDPEDIEGDRPEAKF